MAIRMITLSISHAHLVESDLSGKKRQNLEGEWANLSITGKQTNQICYQWDHLRQTWRYESTTCSHTPLLQ